MANVRPEVQKHLEEVRSLLQQAVAILEALLAASQPGVEQGLQQSLRWTLLQPLHFHITVLNQLLGLAAPPASQVADQVQERDSSPGTPSAPDEGDTAPPGAAPPETQSDMA